jgi:hypothetical protein
MIAEPSPKMDRPGLWLSRLGGAPGKVAKHPHPSKAQRQENAEKDRPDMPALNDSL